MQVDASIEVQSLREELAAAKAMGRPWPCLLLLSPRVYEKELYWHCSRRLPSWSLPNRCARPMLNLPRRLPLFSSNNPRKPRHGHVLKGSQSLARYASETLQLVVAGECRSHKLQTTAGSCPLWPTNRYQQLSTSPICA